MHQEAPFPTLYPLKEEEAQARQLCFYLQKYIARNWHSNTNWIESRPLRLLLCSSDKHQAHLLPRAFAMEITNNLAWINSIKYANPIDLSELKTTLNLPGTIKSMVPAVRTTLIIRDLKAFYDCFNKDPFYKLLEQTFDVYLNEIANTRNIIAGIHQSDLEQMTSTKFFDLSDTRLRNVLFKEINLTVNKYHGAIVIPSATKRELILSPLFAILTNKNFAGFYDSAQYNATLIYDQTKSIEQIKDDLIPFSDEQLEYVVIKPLEQLFKKGYWNTYIVAPEYKELIKQLRHQCRIHSNN